MSRPIVSADILHDAFDRMGASYEKFRIGGRSYVRFGGTSGWSWVTPYGFVSYPFVLYAAIRVCCYKPLAYDYATSQGITTPATLLYGTSTPAEREAFVERYAPIVVKPTNSNGSRGLSLHISSVEAMESAVTHAVATVVAVGVQDVLLQRQFQGQEFRFTVLAGKVVSVIWRQTPQVVGDGQSGVAQLVAAENQARTKLQFDYIVYPQLTADLIPADVLNDDRVPAEGEVVELGRSTMVSGGASLYNVTDTIDASYKELALRVARGLSPDFLVVDLMIADYQQPATDDNYVFLECNTSPSLKLYYAVRDGKTYDIATDLAATIVTYRSSLLPAAAE